MGDKFGISAKTMGKNMASLTENFEKLGKMSTKQLGGIKDLLFGLPDITSDQWTLLQMYIDRPIEEAERTRLLNELQSAITSKKNKKMVEQALTRLVQIDGMVTADEARLVEEVKEILGATGVGFVGKIGNLFKGSVERREQRLKDAPNREEHFEDYVANKVYYSIVTETERAKPNFRIEEHALRKLCLAGGLMARIAHADLKIDDTEVGAIERSLRNGWGISEREAAFVARTAVDQISLKMDYHRMVRDFYECTEPAERAAFLDVLFSVASADGRVTNDEVEEIRALASALRLSKEKFIASKVRVPKHLR